MYMISDNYFNVYNASAGTGKTFCLVRDYLILILNSNNIELYKKILAITFTNKAVNEMKGRIISYLINYSNSIDPDKFMINEICDNTNKTKEEVFLKSSKILKNLLKNYGAFEISTIDKFTQKIVRNFTYELGIDSKYEVEIDQNEILSRAIDNLISKIKKDDDYSKELINFSFEKTDNDKSWDITKDLKAIARLIYNENNYEELESLDDLRMEDFDKWKKELRSKIDNLEKDTKQIARDTLNLIDNHKISYYSFSRQSIPNHFKKIEKGYSDNLYNNKLEENLNENNLYTSKTSENDKQNIEKIRDKLLKKYLICKNNIFKLKLYRNAFQNLSPLSILSQIKKELELLKKEDNFILISEFNKLVNEEIKNQPAPFIYEKIGSKFSHYFIDEFQDTSKMQWENLNPLIENSLSSESSSLTIAGDPKQSIYRWRGGDVDAFINILENESPFYCKKYNLSLDRNFRSSKEIINFNNNLFKYIKEIYPDNHKLRAILDFPDQISAKKDQGYINISFCDDEIITKEEFYNNQTLKKIVDLISRGYLFKDICIIVRKKKEGIAVGDFLSENKIPIISSEVLNLSSSPEVRLVVSLIEYSISQTAQNKINLCKSMYELDFISISKEEFLIKSIEMDFSEIKKYISIDSFELDLNKLKGVSIYEALEYIIDEFGIMKQGNSYLQFFLDFAIDYTTKFQTSLSEFIEYYKETEDKLNVINPEEINAVEIMTIHKSKGLEFPVVIYPYADINVHKDLNPQMWIKINDDSDQNKSLININKDLEKIDRDLYNEYKWNLEVDNINLLYVVLSRAKKELYILSNRNIDAKGFEKTNLFSGIFISFLKKIGAWVESKYEYEIGAKERNMNEKNISKNIIQNNVIVNSRIKKNIIIRSKNANSWINNFDVAKEEGNTFHEIMSEIYSKKDVELTLNKFYELGHINKEQKIEYLETVNNIIGHPKLLMYFNDDVLSYNEREIISISGNSVVPDKLIFLNKINVVIIDYKTGLRKSSHQKQLKKYEVILKEMNFKISKKILVYIGKKIEVEMYE